MTKNKWQSSAFGPTKGEGVYCVLSVNLETGKRKALYVGSSKNISSRVLNPSHPYRILYNRTKYPEVIIIKTKSCADYLETEKSLIRRLQPVYNTMYKASI